MLFKIGLRPEPRGTTGPDKLTRRPDELARRPDKLARRVPFNIRERASVVAFGLAVVLSLPNALHPPAADTHPGFTHAFVWMAYALTPWSALLPFAIMRAKWPVVVVASAFLGAAIVWRSSPLAAMGCAIAVAPMLDDLPTSTVLAVGVLVIGGLIAHDLMPTAKLLARASALVTAVTAVAAVVAPKYRGAVIAVIAVVASVVVHVAQR